MSCFYTSTKDSVITVEKKCNCFEHSIHNNIWISSNTRTVYRWHVSFLKKSKCKIGIISNRLDEEQKHFGDYNDIYIDIPSDDEDAASEIYDYNKWTTVVTLTLDLSGDSAILYWFENYDISLKNVISNNISKGDDIKYKFTIKEISLHHKMDQKIKVSMFLETINQTCLFQNYDLSSVSSIVQFACHTANCLVYGYISNSTKLTIPRVIKELCVYYFIGSKYFMSDFREDLLSDLNPAIKAELFALLLNIIYPGSQNVASMLQKLIDYCHVFETLSGYTNDKYMALYDKRLYLSLLISLTDIIDFYQTLHTAESNVNYNELVVKITNWQGVQGIKLIYKLLKQNSKYYSMYAQNAKFAPLSIRNHAFRICNKLSDTIYLRQLLVPFMHYTFKLKVDITSLNSTVSCLLQELSNCREIQWLWLDREVHTMVSTQNKLSDQYLSSLVFDILTQIQLAEPITYQCSSNSDEERYRCAQIAASILGVITKVNQLDVRYVIKNLCNLLELVTITFRSNEYGIVGWKILNKEMDKILNNRQYTFYDDWLSYIDSKCGLFKSNLIQNLNIVKNKREGNKSNAQKQLEIATKTCFNINKLPASKLKNFTKLYLKIKKTSLLKPILDNL